MISTVSSRVAVALAATVVAVAGCGPATVAGRAVAPERAAVASTAPERVVPVFEDVTHRGERFNANPERPAQWAPTPTPGSLLVQHPIGTGKWACTLGPAMTGATDMGFLTAGHCADGESVMTAVYTAPRHTDSLYLGPLTDAVSTEDRDHAAIWTTGLNDPSATRIAGLPVAGVMDVDTVRELLKPGDPICVSGARAGVVCSPLRRVGTHMITFENSGGLDGGDSGAPAFVVVGGNALVIGLYGWHHDRAGTAVATHIEPALRDLDAKVLTDPTASAVDPELLAPDLAQQR